MKIHIALFAAVLLGGCSQKASNAGDEPAAQAQVAPADASGSTPSSADTGAAAGSHSAGSQSTAAAAMPEGADAMAQGASDMSMSAAEHEQMAGAGTSADAATMPSGTGVVKSVDREARKITIAHGPIEALQWPAMTMAFSATAAQLDSVKEGEPVRFEFKQVDGESILQTIEANR